MTRVSKWESAILVFRFHVKIRESNCIKGIQFNLYVSRSIDRVYIVWRREKKVSRLGIADRDRKPKLIFVSYSCNMRPIHLVAFFMFNSEREREKEGEHSGLSFTVSLDPYHLVFHLRSVNCFFAIASRAGPVFFRSSCLSVSCFSTTRYSERDNIDAYLKSGELSFSFRHVG